MLLHLASGLLIEGNSETNFFFARKFRLPKFKCSKRKCHSQVSESCVLEKKHRDPCLKGKAWRTKQSLELIHLYLCSDEVPSIGGSKYSITFIDAFSKKTSVYFFKNKFDACDVFKNFKVYREAEWLLY